MQKYKSRLISVILLLIIIHSCDNNYEVSKVDYKLIKIDSTLKIENDSTTLALIAPYKKTLDSVMKDTIGYSSMDLIIEMPEGTMNNFVADVFLEKAKINYRGKPIDFCMTNIAGIRKNIAKGVILRSDVYELLPFDNKLVVVELAGTDIEKMLEYIAKTGGQPVSGLKMGIKCSKPINVFIKGEAFDKKRNYVMLTNDYLADGGDDMSFFKNSISKIDLDILGRNAVLEYIIDKNLNGMKISSLIDNRIYNEE